MKHGHCSDNTTAITTTILRLSGFCQDNPGELVPEETFTHSHLTQY